MVIHINNTFLRNFDSIIKIKITGKNINNYIKKIIKSKINILDLKYISYKEVILTIYYKDYLKLLKRKTIYDIEVIDRLGKLKIEDKLRLNKILIIMIVFGAGLLYTLSNIIFDIEVVHSKSDVRNLIIKELNNNGISKYKFKKNTKELNKIKDKILEDNKDTLEWLEIIVSGTKYIVKVQERVINKDEKENKIQNIVSSKNATITKINAIRGEKVTLLNTYVHKGDTIITGILNHTDGTITYVSAEGIVYGDVWYIVEIEYPLIYNDVKSTGNKETVYVLNFLNQRIKLFSSNKYKTYNHKDTVLLSNCLIPISLIKENREETIVTESIYTEDEALNEAIELAGKRLLESNNKIQKINKVHILTESINVNSIKLKLFISVNEDITEIREIDPSSIETKGNLP